MPIRNVFKVSRRTFLNPTAWIDWGALREQNRTLGTILRNLFTPDRPRREETFNQAMTRLHLNEEDIKNSQKNYRNYAVTFFVLGLLVFFYAFYLLFRYGAFFDWVIGLAVTTLFFSQAFRYDFWALQIRERKLGLTFADWKTSILGGKGKSK